MPYPEWSRGDDLVTTDPARVDLDMVHGFLTTSYWCEGISRELVARSIENAIPFSVFAGDEPAGFARVVTDRATVAYVGDVFVLPEARGRGLSVWMMECIVAHPELQGLRRWMLSTRDAHAIYATYGFTAVDPAIIMQRIDPEAGKQSPRPPAGES